MDLGFSAGLAVEGIGAFPNKGSSPPVFSNGSKKLIQNIALIKYNLCYNYCGIHKNDYLIIVCTVVSREPKYYY